MRREYRRRPLPPLVDDYLRSLALDNKSRFTVATYRDGIGRFLRFLDDAGYEVTTDVMTDRRVVRRFAGWLRTARGYAGNTLAVTLSATGTFAEHLAKLGLIAIPWTDDENPWHIFRGPCGTRKRLPRALTLTQVELLFARLPNSTLIEARDRAILELLYSSGLRVRELVGINVEDLEPSLVRVLGKGRRERLVPVGRPARRAIQAYLGKRGRPVKGRTTLFASNKTGRRLTARQIERMVQRRCHEALGLDHVTPHWFRHTFATHLAQNGADIASISQMLGHEDIETTMIYVHVRPDLRETHQRAFPR